MNELISAYKETIQNILTPSTNWKREKHSPKRNASRVSYMFCLDGRTLFRASDFQSEEGASIGSDSRPECPVSGAAYASKPEESVWLMERDRFFGLDSRRSCSGGPKRTSSHLASTTSHSRRSLNQERRLYCNYNDCAGV